MTPKQVRAIALSFEGAHEEPHFERTSFRVGKKIFATMTPDGSEAMVKVSPRKRLEQLLESHPEIFFSYGGWTERFGSLGVRLEKIKIALMKELLEKSFAQTQKRKKRQT